MDIDHQMLVALSKSWGLFYLIAFSVGVILYAYWPSNREGFDRAKLSVLENDDTPRRPEER